MTWKELKAVIDAEVSGEQTIGVIDLDLSPMGDNEIVITTTTDGEVTIDNLGADT